MKRLATQLLGSRAKPKRIRHDILDKFEPEKGAAPKLSQVQHFIGHYKRTRLKESDFVEDMEILATGLKYYDEIGSIDPFIFGYEVEGGKPTFGDGTDEHPLVVGVSTPFMLKKLSYANEHIVHIDATYKLNQSGYPTIVLGVSDRARSFHPVAIFITSQVTGPIIHKVLVQLFNMYCVLTGELPEIRYCMADADKAQCNAVQSAVALKTRNPEKLVFLMCFFHVVKNVGEHVSKL
ncbi:hypothetical protein PR001_g10499 [Phytophthora rubi]|uniref:MULE transposase domain-containing protein n=1 Tax=Phytophthora rubi TaxID=129364 RepID=A0A6A3MTS3_9STRA|nr:hypothetical protein PR001_g10499 [Phytophthora rubi]